MRISDKWYGFLLNIPGLLVVLFFVLYPTWLLVSTSFLKYDNMSPIVFIGLGNYQKVFGDRLFWMSIRKVAIFSVGTTVLTFLGGLLLALPLSGIKKFSGLLRSLMIMPWAVPAVVSGMIWKWMFSPDFGVISDLMMKAGLIDQPLNMYSDFSMAMLGVIIADSWTRIPFMGIILLAALVSIPQELFEVAKIDGAGAVSRFLFISLPLIRGPMMVGLLITVMFSFRTIDIIIPLTAGGPGRATYVFGYYIWDQIIKTLNFGLAAAAGMMLFAITGAISVFFFYFSRGKDE